MRPVLQPTQLGKVKQLRTLARWLDEAFVIPGTTIRIGLDSLAGLIPGVGDLIGAGFSAYIIAEAAKLGVPRSTIARMVGNLALDSLAGVVPVVGDLFDVSWKANMKNIALLDAYLSAHVHDSWEAAPERSAPIDVASRVVGR